MKRVVLLGAYGQNNIGDEALLEMFLEMLRGAEIIVNSASPEITETKYQVRALPTRVHAALWHMARELLRSDLVVFGGGSLLKDLEGKWIGQLLYNARLCASLTVCKIGRVPTMMVGIGCGPFEKRSTRIVSRIAAGLVSAISVRDRESADLLRSIGITRPIEITADPVFVWTRPASDGGNDADRVPRIAIVPRYSLSDRERSILARLCDRLIDRDDAEIVFVAFQTGFSPRFDDLAAIEDVRSRMRFGDRAQVRVPASPKEAIDLIAASDFLISVRLHALIFAALTSRPGVALSYDPKVASFMSALDQSDAVLDLRAFEEESCLEIVDRVWNEREQRSRSIATRTAELRTAAQRNFDRLFERYGRPCTER